MPESRSYDDEVADQPWFAVEEIDIFPVEFRRFLWFPAPLRKVMEEHHDRLFTPEFWQELQQRTRRRELLDFYPYAQEKRFGRQCRQPTQADDSSSTDSNSTDS